MCPRPATNLSGRVATLQPAIMQVLQAHFRKDTISLAQGVPYFPPPPEAIDSVKAHLTHPAVHRYGPDAGLPGLRRALSGKLLSENGIRVGPDRIMVTSGANQAFMNAILAITDPGDEIILLRPSYFNHEMALGLAGVAPVCVDTGPGYQPVPVTVERAITPRTRAVVTVSPNNPTGAVYERGTLRALNRLCRDRGIYHISDEPYEYFTFGSEPHYSPAAGNEDHTITLHSFSKSFGMPGWRIGYMSHPAHLEAGLLKVQDTLVICPSVIGQHMALHCLEAGRGYVEPFLGEMRVSRDIMLEGLRELGDVLSVPETGGGFYFYAGVHGGRGEGGSAGAMTGHEVAVKLIRDHGVAVVPGEPFGSRDGCFLRLSYGNVGSDIAAEGMRRLEKGIRAITASW